MDKLNPSFKGFFEGNGIAFKAGQEYERQAIRELVNKQSDSILFSKSVVLNMINQREKEENERI